MNKVDSVATGTPPSQPCHPRILSLLAECVEGLTGQTPETQRQQTCAVRGDHLEIIVSFVFEGDQALGGVSQPGNVLIQLCVAHAVTPENCLVAGDIINVLYRPVQNMRVQVFVIVPITNIAHHF